LFDTGKEKKIKGRRLTVRQKRRRRWRRPQEVNIALLSFAEPSESN